MVWDNPVFFDPFGLLSGTANRLVVDAWTTAMIAVWNAGLWVLKIILQLQNYFLTPDIAADGPAKEIYQLTAWIAVCLVVIMLMVQLGTAAIRRDGKSVGRVLLGVGQFIIVWVAWIAYGVAVIAACAALNSAFLKSLFGVETLAAWDPWETFTGQDITDGVVATVLGMLGGLLWLAGIAYLLVILTRAGALIVLAVTTPICAAGLVSEAGRSWFWKSFRWFHAAAFAPVVMTLMMGLGIQTASGAALGLSDSAQSSIASALPAVGMILMSAVSPLALFKLLAFMDPGTSSGAAVRAGMSAIGGVGGLMQGGSGTASQADSNGRSSGEQQAEAANSSRMLNSASTAVASAGGAVGAVVGTAVKVFGAVGGAAASIGTDVTNQMGVGHNTYQPDWITGGQQGAARSGSDASDAAGDPRGGSGPQQDLHQADPETPDSAACDPQSPGSGSMPNVGSPGTPPPTPSPAPPAPSAGPAAGSAGGGSSAAAGGSSSQAAAAAVVV